MLYLNLLPLELIALINSKLDDLNDINNFCQIHQLCKDPDFWHQQVLYFFPGIIFRKDYHLKYEYRYTEFWERIYKLILYSNQVEFGEDTWYNRLFNILESIIQHYDVPEILGYILNRIYRKVDLTSQAQNLLNLCLDDNHIASIYELLQIDDIKYEINQEYHETIAMAAVENNEIKTLKLIVDDEFYDIYYPRGLLQLALDNENYDILKMLLEHPRVLQEVDNETIDYFKKQLSKK